MHNRTIEALLAHWNDARGENVAARRHDINPAKLGVALPYIFMLEACENGLKFRLAGTSICSLYDRELRGMPFSTLWQRESRKAVQAAASEALKAAKPILISAAMICEDCETHPANAILLPVSNDAGTVDRLIGALELPRLCDPHLSSRSFSLEFTSFSRPILQRASQRADVRP